MIISKQIQEYLGIAPDGKFGKETRNSIVKKLVSIGIDCTNWSDERLSIGIQQLMMGKNYSGKIDGYVGPMYRSGLERYQNSLIKVDKSKDTVLLPIFPKQVDVPSYYGKVGENQELLELPYPCKLSWEPKTIVHRISLHKKVISSADRVLNLVLKKYGIEGIEKLGLNLYSGSLNVRKMRGGNSYSMHSWGIAIDWDAEHNEMRMDHREARFARPEYKDWWDSWESEGWVSLGKERDFDWMHVQAARL